MLETLKMTALAVLAGFALAGSFAGCGSSDGDGEMVAPQDDGGGGTTSSPDGSSGSAVVIPEYSKFVFADVEEAYPAGDIEACKAFDPTQVQRPCICEMCFEWVHQCDSLEGCTEILQCELESGCTDEISCYLATDAPCTEVIDRWGNAGTHTALTVFLGDCADLMGCRQPAMPADAGATGTDGGSP